VLGVALAVASPALRSQPADGFPLSTYPMFSSDRGSRVSVGTAVAFDAAGAIHRLDPRAVGGGDEVMLAASTVRIAIEGGTASADRLCREIADRLAGDAVARRVEVRTEVHDALAWFEGDRDPLDVVAHARCAVAP